MEKTKAQSEVSPKGVFQYPRLTTPDTKFNANGVYGLKLRLTSEAAQPLVEMIDAAIEAQVESVKASGKVKGKVKRADPPYVVDEETGEVIVNFRMTASGKRKDGTEFTQKPALKCTRKKDGKLQVVDLPAGARIGGGSEGRVAFTLNPFFPNNNIGAGVSLRLKAVQVTKLIEPSSTYGFEAEDEDEVLAEDDSDAFGSTGESTDSGSGSGEEDASGADF